MKNKILIVLICLIFCSNLVYAQKGNTFKDANKTVIFQSYEKVNKKNWNTSFKKQTKRLHKTWKKEAIIGDEKYKTSYARVIIATSKKGELLWYKIKSSCVPQNDKEFLARVEDILNIPGMFVPLPEAYSSNALVYTIEFHSYLSTKANPANINWNKYGVAYLELSKKQAYTSMKEN